MRNYKRIFTLAFLDLVFITTALTCACILSDETVSLFTSEWFAMALVAVVIKILIFVRIGLYRAVLRYASVEFLVAVLKAVTIGSFAMQIVLYLIGINPTPRILIVDWLLTIFFVGGSRFIVRYYQEFIARYRKGRKVLIYGAGDLGAMAMRLLKQDKYLNYQPVGFLDDDVKKGRSIIHNVSVLGGWNDLDKIVSRIAIKEIVVAISGISGEKLREIVKECRQRNLMCRIVPNFSKAFELGPMVRDVEIEDLLRRSPRDLDNAVVDKFITGKKVLITGAAGSIGSELVTQCLKHNPSIVIALDQSENGLYTLREEMGLEDRMRYVLADVESTEDIEKVFTSTRPDIVFHAAAYKHVPLLEENVVQAVINNIGGTKNVALMSDKFGVEKFVLISTDKAVKPSSIMGATKRVCELFIQNFNSCSSTEYAAVRFGNVLGSSGSVIPKFIKQIRSGGPVTVTHPDATRYFMLTSEAVQLVLQAASIGNGGSVFILDMGSPVKIVEMAEDLIYLMGREPYKDIEIKFSGLRPGEKITEELISEEIDARTQYQNITVAKGTLLDWNTFEGMLNSLINNAKTGNEHASIDALQKIVKAGCPDIGNENVDDHKSFQTAVPKIRETIQVVKLNS